MDSYNEQSVSGTKRTEKSVLYALCWCATILLVIFAVFLAAGVFGENPQTLEIHWLNVILTGVCLLAAFGTFRWKDRFRMEYDYILRDNTLEISGIFNARRRRRLAEIPLGRVLQMGSMDRVQAQKMINDSALKRHDWFINADAHKYYLVYMSENIRHMAILELNEAMVTAIRKCDQLPRDAWQKEEGKSLNNASLS